MNKKYMKTAIALAKNGEGRVYPNPMVGCVIVKNDKIAGRGWHKFFGAKHAEADALEDAGRKARGADLYVTLEPCNSHGKRPPCTKAIIEAGIKRVFVAAKDPGVSKSREVLEKNGVAVHYGILKKEAQYLIKDYLRHLKTKPQVTVKAAMTLDGKIATSKYDSKWITSEKSRSFTHALRSRYDAVLVGANTALKDNPYLTAHAKGKNPVRIVIDSKLKLPPKAHLLDGFVPTVVIYDEKTAIPKHFKKEYVVLAPVNIAKAKKDFKVIIGKLDDLSLKKILIEGGGNVISSALFSGVVDDICVFIAPKIIGGSNAVSVVGGKGVEKISDALKVKDMKVKKIGADLLVTGKIR